MYNEIEIEKKQAEFRLNIARRVEQLMHWKNWSQAKLGGAAGISAPTLKRVVTGDCSYNVDTLVAIACAFGLTMPEFLYGKRTTNDE